MSEKLRLLLVTVNNPEDVEEVISAMLELDVQYPVTFDSESALELLATEAPIFAGLRRMVDGGRKHNKTVIGVTSEENVLPRFQHILVGVGVDFSEPGTGFAVLLPLEGMIGSSEDI